MYHPTTRVLTILELLQSHPDLSGGAIAERLEVDRRTVRRYITMLQDLGIPIETMRGPHGGYRLRPGFKLPPLMLSDDEALAVTLALMLAQRQGQALDPLASARALAKIERVLPQALRGRLQALRDTVAVYPVAPTPRPDGATLLLLGVAAQEQQRVELRYRSGEGERQRRVDPYGLAYHWERWYLAGWCHLRQEPRIFRVDRVLEAAMLGEQFARPADFDCLSFVLERLASAPWGWPFEVLVEAGLAELQAQLPPGLALLEEAPGGVLMRGQADRLDWLANRLLMLGRPFTVRRPDELREALRQLAREAAALAER